MSGRLVLKLSDQIVEIEQDDNGRYCLNDLYKVSGSGDKKKMPSGYLRNKYCGVDIVRADKRDKVIHFPEDFDSYVVLTGHGRGSKTFAPLKIVYKYAAFISKDFGDAVYDAFTKLLAGDVQEDDITLYATITPEIISRHENLHLCIIPKQVAIDRGFPRYFIYSPCKHGHIDYRQVKSNGCAECRRVRRNTPEGRENTRKYSQEWRDNNPEKNRYMQKKQYERYKKIHGKSRQSFVKHRAEYSFIRSSLNRVLYNFKGSRAEGEAQVGYTVEQLVSHLEGLFEEGMSWDNRSEWHIDHIKSVSAYLNEGITDPKIVNALSNLQPLWAMDNIKKGA